MNTIRKEYETIKFFVKDLDNIKALVKYQYVRMKRYFPHTLMRKTLRDFCLNHITCMAIAYIGINYIFTEYECNKLERTLIRKQCKNTK